MPSVSLIVEHLDSLLDPAAYDDYGPNGLQVPGRDTVRNHRDRRLGERRPRSRARVKRTPTSSSSTTACSGPARRARSTAPPSAGCSCSSTPTWRLAAYHLPLDGHIEHGNNALLADGDRLRVAGRRSAAHKRATIGVAGRLPGRRHRPGRPRRPRARGDRPRAARVHRRPRARAHASGSSPARAPTTSRTRSPQASTRSSPASRSSARWPARRRPRSTSSRPATTPRRRSACAVSATCSRPSFGVRHVFVDVPNPI